MLYKGRMPRENFTTLMAFVELFSSVNSLMFNKEGVATKGFPTVVTLIGGFGGVNALMPSKV